MSLKRIAFLALLATTAAVVAPRAGSAQGGSIYQATLAEAGAKTAEVSTEQLRRILAEKSAVIIDTRSRAEFEAGHIPGAEVLDVPGPDQVAAVGRMAGGDKARALVLYCNGPFCQASKRLGDQLADAGFSNVKRYQLGIPVWRALGGPTVVELGGVVRMLRDDRSAVLIDTRPAVEFANGSLPNAKSAPADDVVSGKLRKIELPEDDFNRRVILFGGAGADARKLAEHMAKRPWHNVMYFPGTYEDLARAVAK